MTNMTNMTISKLRANRSKRGTEKFDD